MKRLLVGVLMAVLAPGTAVTTTHAQATSNCSGYRSSGNPYPCCSDGNCTWWSWKMAKDNWGQSLGVRGASWGNAGSWLSRARTEHFGTSTAPAPGTVAVNTTVGGYGHVAWVYAVDSNNVYVTEMNCDITSSMRYWQYPRSWFTSYIYRKPVVNSIYPQPVWSTADRAFTLYGSGFKPGCTVRVKFPSGGYGTLSGTQIPYVDYGSMSIIATFGNSGWYSLQVRNNDGGWSEPWWIYVT